MRGNFLAAPSRGRNREIPEIDPSAPYRGRAVSMARLMARLTSPIAEPSNRRLGGAKKTKGGAKENKMIWLKETILVSLQRVAPRSPRSSLPPLPRSPPRRRHRYN
jgi:hypothetical protein